MILRENIQLDELMRMSENHYPDRIKFCIHKPTRAVSIDREYHIDMEHELYV